MVPVIETSQRFCHMSRAGGFKDGAELVVFMFELSRRFWGLKRAGGFGG